MWTRRAASDRAIARIPSFPWLSRWRPPRRSALAAWLGVVLAIPSPDGLLAQEGAPSPPGAVQPEKVILTIRSNGIPRGEFTVLRAAEGDFWVRAADLQRLQVPPRPEAHRLVAGESWYSVRALGAAPVFDEPRLALDVDFRAESLPGTHIDLSNRRPAQLRREPESSLLLSYRLSAIRPSRGRPVALLGAELNVRGSGLLLRQETRMDTGAARKGLRRGMTQLIRDDLKDATRLLAGDTFSSAGPYGSTISGAGVQFSKVYDLAPDVIRHPVAQLQASTLLPAEVEVSVDGSPFYRGRVGPGPITLDNLLLAGGSRNVQLVVTDVAGRRQVIDQPFLFTDSVLARGFHEYSYFAGRRSQLRGQDWHYLEPAWQAFHRYGLSDSVTVAAGGEGSPDFHNTGAGVTLRSDHLGLVSLDYLRSRDHVAGTRSEGWAARYTWYSRYGTLMLGRRRFEPGFRTFTTGSALPFPRSETQIALSTSLGRVHVSAGWVRTVSQPDVRETAFVRLGGNLSPRTSVFTDLHATRVGGGSRTWTANLYLRHDFDTQRWAGAQFSTGSPGRTLDTETGKQLPEGEGFGYRAGTSTRWRDGEAATAAFGGVEWNLRPATVGLFANAPLEGSRAYLQADVAGALVGMGGYWGLTRQVADSFVLARLGVPQPGVEIFLNHQSQGRTDDRGLLLIPQLSSLGRQDIWLNEKELGIQYRLPERRLVITPAFRSGNIVDFGITRVRALAGMAWRVGQGQREPVAARSWTMQGPAGSLAIATGSAGDFYLEDAAPGTYRGTLQVGQRSYACRMNVPEFPEPVHELQDGIICE